MEFIVQSPTMLSKIIEKCFSTTTPLTQSLWFYNILYTLQDISLGMSCETFCILNYQRYFFTYLLLLNWITKNFNILNWNTIWIHVLNENPICDNHASECDVTGTQPRTIENLNYCWVIQLEEIISLIDICDISSM